MCKLRESLAQAGPIRYCQHMQTSTNKSALVLFAHGSRDPAWAEPFKAIQTLICGQSPGLRSELAFLEMMQPTIADCIATLAAEGFAQVTVVPLFLAAGRHLREDLPALIKPIQAAHPGLTIAILPPIGEMAEIQEAIAKVALSAALRNR